MRGEGREAEGEAGCSPACPSPSRSHRCRRAHHLGSPIFPTTSPSAATHRRRIERKGGIVIAKSNTPEFAPALHLQRGVRRTATREHRAHCGGSTAAARWRWPPARSGSPWLRPWRSLRRPATYCSVAGLRPSPGRVTRGAQEDLWSPLSVQGPMARNVTDLALFLDSMAGWDIDDPMTYDAPARSYTAAIAAAEAEKPARIAFTAISAARCDGPREGRALHRPPGASRPRHRGGEMHPNSAR